LLGVAVAVALYSPSASALPAFARKYKTSCTTCHVIVPKLNAFGVAFRNNGYRVPFNDEKLVKQEDVSLGAPAWKQVWPHGVWPSSIAGHVPLAVGLLSYVNITPEAPVTTDFVFPEHLQVHGVGTVGENVSYLASVHFMFMEGMTDTQFVRGHVAFHRLLGDPLLNLRVGRFELGAHPFSRFTKRLTDSDYMATQLQTTSGGFQFGSPQSGFELFGAQTGFFNRGGFEYSVGLVNGSNSMYDNNSQKDFYASAGYKFGGYGLTGSKEELTELKATDNYIDNSASFGGFGYIGRSQSPFVGEVRFNRWGLRGDISIQKLNLYGAYIHGSDVMTRRHTRQNSNSWFLEADYVILPWVIALVRYDQVLLAEPVALMDGGHAMLTAEPTPVYHIMAGDVLPGKRLVPALVLAIRANITLNVEGVFPTGRRDPALRGSPEMQRRGRIGLKFFF
jgi:hypothetical protein